MMTIDCFWEIIAKSREGIESQEKQQESNLYEILSPMETDDVLAFDEHFYKLKKDAYHWDIWGVALIIDGYCSNDGFEYFRRGLIAEGRERFENALKDAETMADWAESYGTGFEIFGTISLQILDEREEYPPPLSPINLNPVLYQPPPPPRGIEWKVEDLPLRFPKAWAKFQS